MLPVPRQESCRNQSSHVLTLNVLTDTCSGALSLRRRHDNSMPDGCLSFWRLLARDNVDMCMICTSNKALHCLQVTTPC